MRFDWRVDSQWIVGENFKKSWKLKRPCIYCLNLMGGSHPMAEIDGWYATRATRSYGGPV